MATDGAGHGSGYDTIALASDHDSHPASPLVCRRGLSRVRSVDHCVRRLSSGVRRLTRPPGANRRRTRGFARGCATRAECPPSRSVSFEHPVPPGRYALPLAGTAGAQWRHFGETSLPRDMLGNRINSSGFLWSDPERAEPVLAAMDDALLEPAVAGPIIGGRLREAGAEPVYDPSNRTRLIGRVAVASEAEAKEALDRAAITVNKNGIPFDTKGPQITSGIRIVTPAVTTRCMKENEMRLIASYIADVISNINDEKRIQDVAARVKTLCAQFPLYQQRIQNL